MKLTLKLAWSLVPLLGTICVAADQTDPPAKPDAPPDRQDAPRRGDRPRAPGGGGDPLSRLMKLDADNDGALTAEEVNDPRLQRLLTRADADKDGKATREELTALFAKEGTGARRPGGPDGDAGGPPDGPPRENAQRGDDPPGGPPDGDRPPGPGRGRGGPPMPGQVLPPRVQDELQLTDAQKKELAELQKDVDARLDKILTEEQRTQLKELRNRRPRPGGPPGQRPGERRPPEDGPPPPPREEAPEK